MPEFIHAIWANRYKVIAVPMTLAVLVAAMSLSSTPSFRAVLFYRTSPQVLPFDAAALETFLGRFYSQSNKRRLQDQSEQRQASEMAEWLKGPHSEESMRSRFDVSVKPDYIDYRKKTNLRITLDRSWAENLEKLEGLKADLIEVRVAGMAENEAGACIAALRHNVEQQQVLYLYRDYLESRNQGLRNELVALNLTEPQSTWLIEKERNTAAGLAQVKPKEIGNDVVLDIAQLDRSKLPVTYQQQLHAADSVRGELDSEHRLKLMGLYQKLIAHRQAAITMVDDLLSRNGGLADVQSFYGDRPDDDDLRTQIESDWQYVQVLSHLFSPANPDPLVVREPRGTLFKTIFAFVVGLMLSLFWVAFELRPKKTT